MTEPTPKYRWRHTWVDEPDDFTGFDGAVVVGRIFKDMTTPNAKGKWRWAGGHAPWIMKMVMPNNGWCDTPRQAAKAAEDHYEIMKKAHGRT